ncbi:hypothetical protein LWI29_001328 [Acer saccharum]|uniref:Uncharacterized protein n=1 Tax=Acer saccharum TaxID=4024 RepID=A0AA39VRG0_ACESA|nr:hypothetical protein LWI29_001328 [Acer saccharum]
MTPFSSGMMATTPSSISATTTTTPSSLLAVTAMTTAYPLSQVDDASLSSLFLGYSTFHNLECVDTFENDKFENPKDEITHKKSIKKKRVFKFLLGLNRNLDDVRGKVMAIKPLPTLREAFFEVVREESRRKVMLGVDSDSSQAEGSALTVHGNHTSLDGRQKRGGRPWCDHCRRPGHYKNTCWKIHGKPTDWKPKSEREGKGNTAVSGESLSKADIFSKDQLDLLKQIINQ